ncbi:Predicted enzyme related to lactoylglutathione lyase [Kingella potus]|uniref:Predicted enzyme related to lactoylglutathione lyase n=1 Tax=Kingella potus TaxID=265175 RepID=A0A377R414_9NEIS|nr:Predicted enzyme related to lactoylglutathione lyase [Kingella potus]
MAGGRFYLFGADWQRYGVSGMIWHDEGADSSACGGCTLFFSCADCESAAQKAVECGGRLLRGKFAIANGFAAFVEDSEGNRIGLHSPQ